MPVKAKSDFGAFLVLEDCQPHAGLSGSSHRHEPTLLETIADQPVVVADERHCARHAAHSERYDEPAAILELVGPGGRDVGSLHGDEDAVIRRVLGHAELCIAERDCDVLV